MDEKCPFFGLEDDPETAATFPTDRNRCYRLPKSRPVSLDQQGSYCLSSNYPSCQIYQMQPSRRLALPVFPSASVVASNPFFWPVSVILLAFVAMIGLFFYARSIWGSDLSFSLFASELSKYTQPRPTNTPTLSPFPSATHLQPLTLETLTPVPTRTGTSTPTETFVPTVLVTMLNTDTDTPDTTGTALTRTRVPPTSTAYPSATVCSGPPFGWSRYIVRFGDTLNSIAVANGVSIAQLQLANCMGSSITIYAGGALYVPHAATQVVVPTRTFTSAPAPTKTKRPAPSNTPKPPPSDTPVPLPSDTPVPPPTAEPPTAVPAATDTTAPYPSG
jgi:hypothetical protein